MLEKKIRATKTTIQIRVEPVLLEWVDEVAIEEDRSRSWIINRLISQARDAARNKLQQPESTAS